MRCETWFLCVCMLGVRAGEEKQFVMKMKEGVLGRPMHVGQLYDKTTDKIIMGGNLINENKLPPGCVMSVEPINEVQEKYTVDTSLKKSGDLLDIHGEVAVKFQVGNLQGNLKGALGLTKDDKVSTRVSRLVVSKKIRTISKGLDVGCLKWLATLPLFDKLRNVATHIVSSVAYGATIVFTFDEDTKSGNETQNISGFLKGNAALKGAVKNNTNNTSAGSGSGQGRAGGEGEDEDEDEDEDEEGEQEGSAARKGDLNMSASVNVTIENKKNQMEKNVKIKFHGDVFLPVNPVSIDHAMQVLSTINVALGDEPPEDMERKRKRRQDEEDEEDAAKIKPRAVPVLVTFTPLHELDSKEARLVREIDKGFVDKALSVFEEIKMSKRLGNDVLQDATMHGYFPAKKMIYEIKDMVFAYEMAAKGRFAAEIELIRKMEHQNRDLIKNVWIPHTLSPFKLNSLGYFVEDLHKHCQILKEPSLWLLKAVKPIYPAREAMTIIQSLITYKYLLIYKHHEMTSDQPFLNRLNEYLQNDTNTYGKTEEREEGEEEEEEKRRKRSVEDFEPYRRHYFNRSRSALAVRLAEFMALNIHDHNLGSIYFTKDIEYDKSVDRPYPTIYLYEKSRLVDDDYQIPTKPRNVVCFHRTHESLHIGWNRSMLGSGNVVNYEVQYFLPGAKLPLDAVYTGDNFTRLEKLNPNVAFKVNVTPLALPGRCETSDTITCATRPSSQPSEPTMAASGESSIVIAFLAPAVISPRAEFLHYSVEYAEDEATTSAPITQTHEQNINERIVRVNVSYLTPKIPYKFRAAAVFTHDRSLPGAWSPPFWAGLECEYGWQMSFTGTACYMFSRDTTVARGVHQAHRDCETRGSAWSAPHLVTVFDSNELYAVQEMSRRGTHDATYEPIWVGLEYDPERKQWLWRKNPRFEEKRDDPERVLSAAMMAHFSADSDYRRPGERRCVYIGSDLQFHTDLCGDDSRPRHYMCKKKIEAPGCKRKGM